MDKCRECPLSGRDVECIAQRLNHARTCELVAADSPGQRGMVLRDAETPIDFTPTMATLAGATLTGATPAVIRTIPLADSMRLIKQMRTCPERTPCHTCGGKATCALGKGRGGTVYPQDCFSCLSENPPPDLPPIDSPGDPGPPRPFAIEPDPPEETPP